MYRTKPGVYMILNVITNERYVGGTAHAISRRWSEHRSVLNHQKRHPDHALQRAWREFGPDAFQLVVLENTAPDPQIVRDREQAWMDKFRTQGFELYNGTRSAADNTGMRHHREVCERMAQSRQREWCDMPPEVRQRRVAPIREYWDSRSREELGQAVSIGLRQRRLSMEPRRILSPEGKVVTFHLLMDFCEEHGLDPSAITKVCAGKRPSHKGWRTVK